MIISNVILFIIAILLHHCFFCNLCCSRLHSSCFSAVFLLKLPASKFLTHVIFTVFLLVISQQVILHHIRSLHSFSLNAIVHSADVDRILLSPFFFITPTLAYPTHYSFSYSYSCFSSKSHSHSHSSSIVNELWP